MLFLQSIWITAAILILLAIVLWIALLIVHSIAKRHDLRAAAYTEAWMDQLLDVMDGTQPPEALPVPKSQEETEAVIALLRDLAERFSGSYGNRMSLILEQIRTAEFAINLLLSRNTDKQIRGCALLGWCGAHNDVDQYLENALNHKDPRVVLEAASSLVHRGNVTDIVPIIKALCRSRAAKSLLALDLCRRWGESARSDWSELLKSDWTDDGWILLLEAAGASGQSGWTALIAQQANHSSPLVVEASLTALEKLADPLGADAAEIACQHPSPHVRRQAVKTLLACGDPNHSLDLMEVLLADKSFEVRRAAMTGILEFGGRSRLMEKMPIDDWQRELFKEVGLQGIPNQ